MLRTSGKKKSLIARLEEAFLKVSFAEAGELYPEKPTERLPERDGFQAPVCVEGETPSGLCA